MPHARLAPVLLALAFASSVATLACDDEDDEIGTPCESEEDCSEALICDVHDGKGTCQHDHGHRSEEPMPAPDALAPAPSASP